MRRSTQPCGVPRARIAPFAPWCRSVALSGALNRALPPRVRTTPDKRTLLDNFDTLLLTVDELIDGG